MTSSEVMKQLEKLGNEQTKKTWLRHGAPEPFFGVKIGDMKQLIKKIKKNHELSLELFDTGNQDAMYFAGLIADEKKITKKQLEKWAKAAKWFMINGFTVAWVAAESPHGWELGLKWIDDKANHIQSAGWNTLSGWVALRPDEELDFKTIEKLLLRVEKTVRDTNDRLAYSKNSFVISVGSYVAPLTDLALEVAARIGPVEVDMKKTDCKVPLATDYIQKVIDMKRVGQKRKMVRC